MKILLIDQDTHTLEMLQINLSRAGHTVHIAADGHAGLRLTQTAKPDLIVMDILLPGLDGAELCYLLQHDPVTKDIPIIVSTALAIPTPTNQPDEFYSEPKWRALAKCEYLPKPIDLNQFLRKVESLLQPGTASPQSTGPSVTAIVKNDEQREMITAALRDEGFRVYAHSDYYKPISAMRAPAVLILDEDYLTEEAWQTISTFQNRNLVFSLVVLRKESATSPPENQANIDCLLVPPLIPWYVGALVKRAFDYRSAKERTNILSREQLELNQELLESKHAMQAQNTELDQVNRRLHRLNELKETLAGMLVHDLKAPLSAMIGALQFLTMDPNNQISPNSLKIVDGGLAAGYQMQRLTITLLDEHKLENNELVFDIEPIEVGEIVEECLQMLNPLFGMHKVSVETHIPEDLPPILTDPIVLQRIIENLLDNAIKHSPMHEAISVSARHIVDKDMAEICVADRGDGIPTEFRETIFEKFAQLENVERGKARGSVGLGLTFCKLAVESMGGRIWVDNPADFGTAFYFTLPVSSKK